VTLHQEAFTHQLDPTPHLSKYLPKECRFWLETRFYAQINEQARLDRLANDEEFLRDPTSHIAVYSDHGVVHARDVATQILQVMDDVNGVLIPGREGERFEFLRGFGVAEAYLHDIGMVDFSSVGREMHAEFATQAVFSPELDEWVEAVWAADGGGVSSRVSALAKSLERDPRLVFREMLSMACCHSKSKVGVTVLNDRQLLRRQMIVSLGMDLRCLNAIQRARKAGETLQMLGKSKKDEAAVNAAAIALRDAEGVMAEYGEEPTICSAPSAVCNRFHENLDHDGYLWLVSDDPEVRELAADVVDTLRSLRCADALRQRGTVLRTSAGYQVFIDRMTGNAVYAMEHPDGRWFLVEVDNVLSAAEANLAASEFTAEGDVKFTFHRGAFPDAETTQRAAFNLAVLLNDVQEDVIQSFHRSPISSAAEIDAPTFTKSSDEIELLLESSEENMDFAGRIIRELERIDPGVAARARVVPSLQNITMLERTRYLAAGELDWPVERRKELLAAMARVGHRTGSIDLEAAFRHVRSVNIRRGETLVEAATPSGFVYIALQEGLLGDPLGGYPAFTVPAYIPIGHIGVVRGAERNSTIRAHTDVDTLVIPRETYLKHWHATYGIEELMAIIRE
jgi:hypothetical protein